jgi:hypothetical protein
MRDGIPDDFWREVPCGHPPAPVAALVTDCGGCTGTHWVCHCGSTLELFHAVSDGKAEDAPGPIVPCETCGCHVAIPRYSHAIEASESLTIAPARKEQSDA